MTHIVDKTCTHTHIEQLNKLTLINLMLTLV